MYEKLRTTAEKIQSIKPGTPRVGIVLGSGLGPFVDKIESPTFIPYKDIPYFNETTVEGHEGRLILGTIAGVEVAVLQGRVHGYEGFAEEELVFPVRVLATLGIEDLILTNAAGGINTDYSPGQLVLIKDHINFMGLNPLKGPNINELGPRFPDMTQAYHLGLRDSFHSAAKKIDYNLKEGVYCAVLGPTYETPAEIKMMGIIGADMVGMSTVPESIAANHLGLRVAGISCITNMAAGISQNKLDHDEVKREAKKVMDVFSHLLTATISEIGKQN